MTNDPNYYIRQIGENFALIDPAEHPNNMKTVENGETVELQSRIYYDYLIRKSYTNEYAHNDNICDL